MIGAKEKIARTKLQSLLTRKLVHSVGSVGNVSLNVQIARKVSDLLARKKRVSRRDLLELERAVRKLCREQTSLRVPIGSPVRHEGDANSNVSQIAPRPSSASGMIRPLNADDHQHQRNIMSAHGERERVRPSSAVSHAARMSGIHATHLDHNRAEYNTVRLVNGVRPSSATQSTLRQSLSSSNGINRSDELKQRPSTAKARSSNGSNVTRLLESVKNEWLVLDTFYALEREERRAKEAEEVAAKRKQMNHDLKEQMAENSRRMLSRAQKEREREEESLRAAAAEEKEEKELIKQQILMEMMEQRRVRDEQIAADRQRIAEEKVSKAEFEQRLLDECKMSLHAEAMKTQERSLAARAHALETLAHNERGRVMRRVQAQKEAELDVKYAHDYAQREEKEEEQRRLAHEKKIARYISNGKLLEGSDMHKNHRAAEIELERLHLRDCALKEKAEMEREQHDKNALIQNKIRCQQENLKLIEASRIEKARQKEEDRVWASKLRADGEQYANDCVTRKKIASMKGRQEGEILKKQAEEWVANKVAENLGAATMSPVERSLNNDILKQIENNPETADRILHRIMSGPAVKHKNYKIGGYKVKSKK